MKTCKDLNLKLCHGCEYQLNNKSRDFYWGCIVENYTRYLESREVDKILLTRILTRGTILANTGVREYLSYTHMSAVIKEFYPEYNEWFQKMLILK